MEKIIHHLRDAFGFLTIFPIGRKNATLEDIGRSAYLFPLVGLFLGIIAAAMAFLLIGKLPAYVTAAIILALLLYLTGLHHADGLLDLGDALLVKESPTRKLEILKDRYRGVASLALFFFVFLLTILSYGALIQIELPEEMIKIIIGIEVAAKFTLITVAYLGTPSHQGSGAYIVQGIKPFHKYLFALLSSGGILFYIFGSVAFYILLILGIYSWYLIILSREHFNGINGDVLGASHETGRLAVLLILLALNWNYVFL